MKNVQEGIYRILDANLHRVAEGLRVLMDLARFLCDDSQVSGNLKSCRHDLFKAVESFPNFFYRAAQSRDSDGDIGRELKDCAMSRRRDLLDLYRANLHRSQEALRTLEECAKLFDPRVGADIENIRFRLYSIDKLFSPKIEKLGADALMDFELYVVTCRQLSHERGFMEIAEAAIDGGAGAIQLREKEWPKNSLLAAAKDLRALTRERGVTFIMNDHLDVALASEADGCHLGQDDFPISEARRIVGPGFILGASTHNLEEALKAEAEGATYINVGPVFATKTKETGCVPVGLDLIATVRNHVRIPQTCMGGINSTNVHQVIAAGAERVAVVSAVVAAENVTEAAKDLVEKIRVAKQERG